MKNRFAVLEFKVDSRHPFLFDALRAPNFLATVCDRVSRFVAFDQFRFPCIVDFKVSIQESRSQFANAVLLGINLMHLHYLQHYNQDNAFHIC